MAVAQYYQSRGVTEVQPDDVMLGNGVSELISMTMQALIDTGDEVLVPSPDYPLWTGTVTLCGGRPVHYRCDENNGWMPDLEHMAAQITPNTRAMVIINPNNPTGAVYAKETLLGMLDLARKHADGAGGRDLRQDRVRRRAALHRGRARAGRAGDQHGRAVQDLPCGRFPLGLAGDERLHGARHRICGRPAVAGEHAAVPERAGSARGADRARRLPEHRAADRAGRKAVRAAYARVEGITSIPGVECVRPDGALYLFARLDPAVHKIRDDEQLIIDLLEQQNLLLSHGTGFNLDTPDHLRMVFLAPTDVLDDAINRLGTFLSTYRQ